MIVIYEITDPDIPGSRCLFSSRSQAIKYHAGLIAEYPNAHNIVSHSFPDVEAVLAFLESDYRDWNPVSSESAIF